MSPSVLITGAGRGLGQALVHEFAGRSFRVFALVRSRKAANALQTEGNGNIHPIVGDITENGLPQAVENALRPHGESLDMLINNAGISGSLWSIEQQPEEEVARLFETHCVGALRCTRAVLPFLRSAGEPLVVNVSSRLGSVSRVTAGVFDDGSFSYSYRIAKAAQNMLTACLHRELHEQGIKICAVHPGRIRTESAAPGACLTPVQAAQRLVEWALAPDRITAGSYTEFE